jgi:peptidoglycan-associated lipoprotein
MSKTVKASPQGDEATKLYPLRKIRKAAPDLLLIFFSIFLIASALSCGRRPPPPPLPTDRGPTEPASRPDVPVIPPPELELTVEPSVIEKGDSALLQWQARNADHVLISHNIGTVEASGRIKFFPDQTTSYEVTAVGPGGRIAKLAKVEVRTDAIPDIGEADLPARALDELFDYFIKPVFFDYDSSELSQEGQLTLDGNLHWLLSPDNLHVRFLIEGHCDERGTDEYNLALGDRRAQVVMSYLVSHGVNASRISTVSFGEESPFDSRATEESWALNRRAHFVLTKEESSPGTMQRGEHGAPGPGTVP